MRKSVQAGFGLIELMITIAIVALLLVAGLPSLATGMQNRQISAAANAIQSGLQIARTEALRRNRTVQFTLRSQNAYTVGCLPADNTVVDGQALCPDTIQVREAGEGSNNAVTTAVQQSVSSSSTTTFAGSLTFSPLGRVTSDTLPAGNKAVYQVTNPGGGTCAAAGGPMRCLSVVVTTFGQIRTCDPAVSTSATPPDPRSCS